MFKVNENEFLKLLYSNVPVATAIDALRGQMSVYYNRQVAVTELTFLYEYCRAENTTEFATYVRNYAYLHYFILKLYERLQQVDWFNYGIGLNVREWRFGAFPCLYLTTDAGKTPLCPTNLSIRFAPRTYLTVYDAKDFHDLSIEVSGYNAMTGAGKKVIVNSFVLIDKKLIQDVVEAMTK